MASRKGINHRYNSKLFKNSLTYHTLSVPQNPPKLFAPQPLLSLITQTDGKIEKHPEECTTSTSTEREERTALASNNVT